MATVAVVSGGKSKEMIFASVELAKKSVEFSCHKFADTVLYKDVWDDDGFSIEATCPDGQIVKIEEVHVFDRVTHL